MSVKQVSVNVAAEVDDALTLVRDLLVAVKAGKSESDLVSEFLTPLIKLSGELSALPVDFSSDLADSLRCVGLRGTEIALALLGKL